MRRLANQCPDAEYEVFIKMITRIPPDTTQATRGIKALRDALKGRKDDCGKADWSLVPWEAMEPIVQVLMFGAEKYGPENWRDVPDAPRRYWSAAQRHLIAHLQGEVNDDESDLPHLAHAACCVLFLLALELRI
jgi:hypothetical protein